MSLKHRPGFTIVELLIVIVVIAILAAISIIAYNGIQNRAIETTLKSDLRNAATLVGADKALTETYPLTKSAANEGKGLSASPGISLQYTSDGTSFCMSASSASESASPYRITHDGSIEPGLCSGHYSAATMPPDDCPTGFIPVPGNTSLGVRGFCVMKYEAKNVGGVATSQAAGLPWVMITRSSSSSVAQNVCSGCQLITEAQWMALASDIVNTASNWSGGSVGSGTINRGNSNSGGMMAAGVDLAGINKRTHTLSNGEVIWDLAGNAWEWTQGTISGGQPGLPGEHISGSWKDYDDSNLQWNNLPSISQPTGMLYSRSTGIGGLYSNPQTGNRAFIRGGGYTDNSSSGVLALDLTHQAYSTYQGLGFRVTR